MSTKACLSARRAQFWRRKKVYKDSSFILWEESGEDEKFIEWSKPLLPWKASVKGNQRAYLFWKINNGELLIKIRNTWQSYPIQKPEFSKFLKLTQQKSVAKQIILGFSEKKKSVFMVLPTKTKSKKKKTLNRCLKMNFIISINNQTDAQSMDWLWIRIFFVLFVS